MGLTGSHHGAVSHPAVQQISLDMSKAADISASSLVSIISQRPYDHGVLAFRDLRGVVPQPRSSRCNNAEFSPEKLWNNESPCRFTLRGRSTIFWLHGAKAALPWLDYTVAWTKQKLQSLFCIGNPGPPPNVYLRNPCIAENKLRDGSFQQYQISATFCYS